ncbi:MAG: aromatic acid exporter family protein [Bacillota bacterium]
MTIGPRLWKTGLAVGLTFFLVSLTGQPYQVYGAVAAALAVGPSASRSLRTMSQQIIANLIGGLVGSLAVLLFGPNPLVIGLTVILVLLICQRQEWKDLSATAVTVALFVMAPHSDSVTTYTLWRLLSVMIGSVVGTLVNAYLAPPDYQAETIRAMERAGAALDGFIRSVAARLDEPAGYTKQEILAGAARVDGQISELRRLSLLMGESQRPEQARQKEVIDRGIKVLASLLERIQIIHKAALVARRAEAYPQQLPEIQEALEALVVHRRQLFASLLSPDRERSLPLALGELERRFESPTGLPAREADVEPFFRLYRMRSSISYMANRLGRLYVAKEEALPPAAPEAELKGQVVVP